MTERAVRATYRLQLTSDFGFEAAGQLLPYLAQLGVSHLYLSPILAARRGSRHGYDVVDPTQVSPALGGEGALRQLADDAHGLGLGLVVDIVPNHMGTGHDNPDWRRLLAHGQGGDGARVFDVDWHPALPGAKGKVIVPVLGDHYGAVLHNGELHLVDEPDEDGRRFRIRYHEHAFPLSPESQEALERVGRIDTLTGVPGKPETWLRLHGLLEQQHYRLVWWRIGDRVINYRRFFAVSDLAGVSVEDRQVFDRTHDKILELVADGVIDGLRVDHPDGLRDPSVYLERLHRKTAGAWTVVEKILQPDEPLEEWAADGTTGYDFCNDVLGLFVDPAAEDAFERVHVEIGGDPRPYAEQLADAKRQVLSADLAAEAARLSRRLWTLAQAHLDIRDVDDRHCTGALVETLVGMPVYRTYVNPETGAASRRDRQVIATALAHARAVPGAPPDVLDFLELVLTGTAGTDAAHLDFIARFQQLSGALEAKSVEDTLYYRYVRMVALNEVGGDPQQFGVSSEEFHRRNAERARRHPLGMLTTATHDTKRGEDVRLRIAALTEMPQRWEELARGLAGHSPLDGPTASLLLQTMIGIWPLGDADEAQLRSRLHAYAMKAAREAGVHTSWYEPDEAYESSLSDFVDGVLDDPSARADLAAVAQAAASIAMVSSLAQTVLRLLSPGVPDTYQGTELPDDSLVDPDNRRPVDYARRRRLLAEVEDTAPGTLWARRADGHVKLALLRRCLAVRRERPDAFNATSGYRALPVRGALGDHVVGFARSDRDRPRVVAITPRLPGAVMGEELADPTGERWRDTAVDLPDGSWHDALGSDAPAVNGTVPLSALLAALPVAVLVQDD